ncbi:hypothetical protein L9F63_003768 [Diploptera punctata]|uniref:WAP domain-containing protein n=1 Tax=Diploptera punctata TaxID=6984 RepID=A0AAD8E930_DIPPU|nr:hypothetical protein L9F63_003768 [Diploptera punctata]
MRAVLIAIIVSGIAISVTICQSTSKPGQCSPSLPLEVCNKECNADGDCQGNYKCCGTKCGGTVCSFPVSIRRRVNREKPGYCPNPPKGPWVCSSTCSVDVECRDRAKCCRNRCGALRCTTPESEPQPVAEGISARQPEFDIPARQPVPRQPEFENPPEETFYSLY